MKKKEKTPTKTAFTLSIEVFLTNLKVVSKLEKLDRGLNNSTKLLTILKHISFTC